MQKVELNKKDEGCLKHNAEVSGKEFDLGRILTVESTPAEERKLLWKLDLV